MDSPPPLNSSSSNPKGHRWCLLNLRAIIKLHMIQGFLRTSHVRSSAGAGETKTIHRAPKKAPEFWFDLHQTGVYIHSPHTQNKHLKQLWHKQNSTNIVHNVSALLFTSYFFFPVFISSDLINIETVLNQKSVFQSLVLVVASKQTSRLVFLTSDVCLFCLFFFAELRNVSFSFCQLPKIPPESAAG